MMKKPKNEKQPSAPAFEELSAEERQKWNELLKENERALELPEALTPESIEARVEGQEQVKCAVENEPKHKRDKRLAVRLLAAAAALVIVVSSAFAVKPWRYVSPPVKLGTADETIQRASDYTEIEKLFASYAKNYRKQQASGVWLMDNANKGSMDTVQEAVGGAAAPGASASQGNQNGTIDVTQSASSGNSAASKPGDDTAFGKTNEQVKGVSEADILKNDGKYLYVRLPDHANWDEGIMVQNSAAQEPNDGKKTGDDTGESDETSKASGQGRTEEFSYTCAIAMVEEGQDGVLKTAGVIHIAPEKSTDIFYMRITEMYVTGNRLVAILTASAHTADSVGANASKLQYGYSCKELTMAVSFDISDRAHPLEEWRVFQDGDYLSSRMVGDELVLLSSYYVPLNGEDTVIQENCVPRVGTGTKEYARVACDKLCLMDTVSDTRYLVASVLDTDNEKTLSTTALLGGGENVYCTTENLYVTSSEYSSDGTGMEADAVAEIFDISALELAKTKIYKFDIRDYQVKYLVNGTVDGTALNQFSIDESDGYLRIATTSGTWSENRTNQVYVLDGSLKTVGLLKGIAKGEMIKSVRFTGKTGYVVTFLETDPLFVLDLSDPASPVIKGEVKIPGFSAYLHPVGEDLLLGVGPDGDEAGRNGGMKVSLFDVSNPASPKEISKFTMDGKEQESDTGRVWTTADSPAYYNHKALCFDAENSTLYLTYNRTDGSYVQTGSYTRDEMRQSGGVLALKVNKEAKTLTRTNDYVVATITNGWQQVTRATYTGNFVFGYEEVRGLLVSFRKDSAEKISTLNLEEMDAGAVTAKK